MGFPIYRFKYFPDADYVETLIAEGTLKFSYPFTDFNDPFDCLPHLYLGGFDKFLRAARSRGIREKKKELKRRYDATKSSIVNGKFYKFAPLFGVCCLSKDPYNILMWGHYSNNHKGVLVVFKFDNVMLIENEEVFPMPVVYSDERPSISFLNGSEDDVVSWNMTKARCWEYEQEDRMFLMRSPSGVYKFDRELHLEAVVLGARVSPDFKGRVLNSVVQARKDLGTNLPVFEAKVSKTKYQIEIPKFQYKAEP